MNVELAHFSLDVVIATKDRPALLDQAISSVKQAAANCHPGIINIVISDNSELNHTRAMCSIFHSDVHYRRFGPASALDHFRHILSSCNGKYLMIMHDDDRVLPFFFVNALSIFSQHPRLSAVASNAFVINESLEVTKPELFPQDNDVVIDNPTQLLSRYFSVDDYKISPFPSYIYNLEVIKGVCFSGIAGKYSDLIFLCEVAECGQMRWSCDPQYVYRDHGSNDSKGYSYVDRQALYSCLYDRYKPSDSDSDSDCFLRLLRVELDLHQKSLSSSPVQAFAPLKLMGLFLHPLRRLKKLLSVKHNSL